MEASDADRYLALANAYWASAQRLRADLDPAVQSPFYLLACHTIELSLKAVLIRYGLGPEGVMMIGHNIEGCLRHAVRKGFPPPTVRVGRVLAKLSAAHHAQAFRYPQYVAWSLPDPDETMSAATSVLRRASEHVADRPA